MNKTSSVSEVSIHVVIMCDDNDGGDDEDDG